MMQQRSKEWFEARKGRVTGSVAGAILGLSPFSTREDALRSMVRSWHGVENEMKPNIATMHGQHHEDGAVLDFRMETGLDVQEVGFLRLHDWLGASPDGLTSDGGVLEVKVPFGKRNDTEAQFKPLAEQPHYYAQVQIEMTCANRNHAWFWQWSAHGHKLERVEIDLEWLETNLPRLRQFHAEFLDALADPAEHLAPRRVQVDTIEASKLLREWDDMTEAEDRAKERKAALMEELTRLAGNRDAEVCGRKLTRVNRAGSIAYAKAVAALAPGADLEKWRGKPSSFWKIA